MTKIVIIAAITENRGLGYKGDLLVKDPDDLKHFKNTTTGYPIIMGFNTFASLNFKPLPNRQNYVLTRKHYDDLSEGDNVFIHKRLDELLGNLLCFSNTDKIFVIGGGEVYKQALNYANEIILTVFPVTHKADVFFPSLGDDWVKVKVEPFIKNGTTKFVIEHYKRRT